MNIQETLKDIMNQQSLSAYSLSTKSGVSQTMISGILRGDKNPTINTLDLLCKALGITLTDFFSFHTTELSTELKQLINVAKTLSKDELIALNQFLKVLKQNYPKMN